MTHVSIDYFNNKISSQIITLNLAKSKHSHYVKCIVFQYKF